MSSKDIPLQMISFALEIVIEDNKSVGELKWVDIKTPTTRVAEQKPSLVFGCGAVGLHLRIAFR